MHLYHATSKKYLDSILREGLILNPSHRNFSDMYCENKIYLAFSTDAAREYFEFSGKGSSGCVVHITHKENSHAFKCEMHLGEIY